MPNIPTGSLYFIIQAFFDVFNAEMVILSIEDKNRSTCAIAFLPSHNSADKIIFCFK